MNHFNPEEIAAVIDHEAMHACQIGWLIEDDFGELSITTWDLLRFDEDDLFSMRQYTREDVLYVTAQMEVAAYEEHCRFLSEEQGIESECTVDDMGALKGTGYDQTWLNLQNSIDSYEANRANIAKVRDPVLNPGFDSCN